jgi:hypothetical protein
MKLVKGIQTGAIQQDHQVTLQAGRFQNLAADQVADHLDPQVVKSLPVHMAEEMVQGAMDRPAVLVGAGQTIEVVQDVGPVGLQFEVQLPAAVQLQEIQEQTPPDEKASGVSAGVLVAGIGQVLEPVVELGEEVADGLDEGLAEDQGRPFWRRC